MAIDLATAGERWQIDDFSAMLPGETRVDLSGDARHPRRPELPRPWRASSRGGRPRFAAWWRGEVGSAAQIGRFAVDADFDLQPESQTLANLVATTGAGTVTGSVELRRFPQSGQLFVTVDLGADRADLVESARAGGAACRAGRRGRTRSSR